MIGKNAKILTNIMNQGGQIGIITEVNKFRNSWGEVHTEYLIATTVDEKTVDEHWYREKEIEVLDVTKERADKAERAFRKYGEGYIEMSRKRKRRILKVVIALAIVSAFWIGFGFGMNVQ